jgi:hypothetical protein
MRMGSTALASGAELVAAWSRLAFGAWSAGLFVVLIFLASAHSVLLAFANAKTSARFR